MFARCSALARPHLPERLDAGADDVRGRVVHAREDRVVVGAEAVRARRGPGPCRPGAPPRSAPGRVHGGDQVVGGHRRRRPAQPASEDAELARPAAWSGRPAAATSGGAGRSRTRSGSGRRPPSPVRSTAGHGRGRYRYARARADRPVPTSRSTPRGGPPDGGPPSTHTHFTNGRPRAAVLSFRGASSRGLSTPGAPMTDHASPCSRPSATSPSATCSARCARWRPASIDADCFYGISDLHALTTPHDPAALRDRDPRDDDAAAGRRPRRSTLFVQSRVPAHAELAYLLECTAPHRRAEPDDPVQGEGPRRATSTRVSLFTYPVLMAADILLYRPRAGAGRRRPAPARRAHPRPRDPLQQHLRPGLHRPRDHHAAGRGAGDGPGRPDPQDGQVGRDAAGQRSGCSTRPTSYAARSRARSPTPTPAPTPYAPTGRQARRHQPARDPGRLRRVGRRHHDVRRPQGGGHRRRASPSSSRCRSATPSWPPTRRTSSGVFEAGRGALPGGHRAGAGRGRGGDGAVSLSRGGAAIALTLVRAEEGTRHVAHRAHRLDRRAGARRAVAPARCKRSHRRRWWFQPDPGVHADQVGQPRIGGI